MRQLYPRQMRVENYITGMLGEAGKSYGFEEYDAPVLEPIELFLAKSGNELAVTQSYNFTDKGNRNLILRPELTPSLARMVASAGELVYPVKWMSFPLCFRYEKPQRGRAREFLQFNLDILGCDNLDAELEVFLVLQRIMKSLGAGPEQYLIRYSSRRLASALLQRLGFDETERSVAYTMIDKKDRMAPEKWEQWAMADLGDVGKVDSLREFASCADLDSPWLESVMGNDPALAELTEFRDMLRGAGVETASFEAGVVRGLDYYTGIVFEVMDTGGENRRAICGGGRYDNLVGLFGSQSVSGVGFGLGILTLQLFLETYGLIPGYIPDGHPAEIFLAVYSEDEREFAVGLAEDLRDRGISVEMDITCRNLSRQFRTADRKGIRFIATIGPDEVASGRLSVREMTTGETAAVPAEELQSFLESRIRDRMAKR